MDKERIKKLKEELNESFSDEYIRNVGLLISKLAEEFYKEHKLEGQVYFDETIFNYCLIDILVDIARLKYFHDISRVNYIKLIAYAGSWYLKRKPFQLIEGCDEENIYVNEVFVLTMLLHASELYDKESEYLAEKEEDLKENVQKMFYHLKYRNTNPQTLELFLIGMNTGKKIL